MALRFAFMNNWRRGAYSGIYKYMPVHIGKFIQQKLKEDGHSVTWFASKICCTRSNVYKIFANDNIDIKLLIWA